MIGLNQNGLTNDCYANGEVIGTYQVGGLIGNDWSGQVINCYATGSVSGNSFFAGGLIGKTTGTLLTACFWDTQTSNLMDGIGNQHPDPIGVTGLITTTMQTLSTFTSANWDFTNEIPVAVS